MSLSCLFFLCCVAGGFGIFALGALLELITAQCKYTFEKRRPEEAPDWGNAIFSAFLSGYFYFLFFILYRPSGGVAYYCMLILRYCWIPILLCAVVIDKLSKGVGWKEYCLQKIRPKKRTGAEKEAEEPVKAGKEPEEEKTAMALARLNGEKILAYCKEHHYDMLPDMEKSVFVPDYLQDNLCTLITDKTGKKPEERETQCYFTIKSHEIKVRLRCIAPGEKNWSIIWVDITEESELAALLMSCVVNDWSTIQSWLKEPEKLMQKCLTFSPEK